MMKFYRYNPSSSCGSSAEWIHNASDENPSSDARCVRDGLRVLMPGLLEVLPRLSLDRRICHTFFFPFQRMVFSPWR